MTEAISYARCSDVEQKKGGSIERQTEGNRAQAERKGWSIISEIGDHGRSGFHADHRKASGALGRFEAEALAGEHHGRVLIVERLDRLSRETAQKTWNLICKLTDAGVSISTTKNDKFYPAGEELPMWDIMEILFTAHGNNEESQKKSDHIAREWDKRRDKAEANGTALTTLSPPWVIVAKDRTMRLDPPKAALVLRWFHMADQGMGAKAIADTMDREGIPTWERFAGRRAKRWQRTFISRVLSNRAVIGEFAPTVGGVQQEPWTNYFPAVVPADLFARVNAAAGVRKQVSVGNRSEKVANLVSGLVKCGACGSTMHYRTGRKAGSKWTTPAGKTYSYKRDCGSLVCPLGEIGKCGNSAYFAYLSFEDGLLDQCLHLALDDNAFSNRGEVGRLNVTIAERERALELAKQAYRLAKDDYHEKPSALRKADKDEAEAKVEEIAANVAALIEQRERAKGRADQAAHLKRVADVRGNLYHDDLTLRVTVRKKVSQALRTLIEGITFGSQRVVVSFVAGAAILHLDRKGRLIGHFDLVKDSGSSIPQLQDYARRRASAKAENGFVFKRVG